MAWGKTEEEKQAAREEKANAEWWNGPVGQAHSARERGDKFFQVEIETTKLRGTASSFGASNNGLRATSGAPDVLGQIEERGWRLEHVNHVFVETGATTSNRIGSTGQGMVTRGVVLGIYLFRAV